MEDKTTPLEDLRQEATELGIEFAKNIGATKLQEKIDTFYDAESKANTVTVEVKKDTVDKPKAENEDDWNIGDLIKKEIAEIKELLVDNPKFMHKVITSKIDAEARETAVVKLTMVDKREASTATDAYFNNGTLALRVPLDTWVEMPKGLIAQADAGKAVIHVESNGVTSPKLTKKYVIEYK